MAGVIRILLGGLLILTGLVFFVIGAQGSLVTGLFGLFYFIPGLGLAAWGFGAAGLIPRLDVVSWFTKVGTKRIVFGIFCVFLGLVIVVGGISSGLIWVLLGIPFLVWGLWAKTKSVQSQKRGDILLQQPMPLQPRPSQPWAPGPVQSPQFQPASVHIYCSHCGVPNVTGSARCRICGADL
jgi:hypothetical protein